MVKKIGAAMAAKGIAMLDAPVQAGGTVGARPRQSLHGRRDKKVFDDALPVLQSFSAKVIHMGRTRHRHGGQAGQQHDGLLQQGAAAEGLMLGVTAGLDPQKTRAGDLELERNSSAFSRSRSARSRAGSRRRRSRSISAHKDLHLALELADELDVCRCLRARLPTTCSAWRAAWGLGNDDSSAVLRVYETVLRDREALGQVPGDQARDEVGMAAGHVVIAARHDLQSGLRQAFSKDGGPRRPG